MTALMVILSRFVSLPLTDSLRVSLECVPIILAGVWAGPVAGMIVGGLGDVIGAILFPFGPYFFPLTIGPAILGLICGLLSRNYFHSKEKSAYLYLVLTVIAGEALNSLLYGTWALTLYYSIILGREVSFWFLFVPRLLPKLLTMGIDALLCAVLHKILFWKVIEKMHLREVHHEL